MCSRRPASPSPPTTWDELVDAAKKIKAQGGDVAGFGLQGKEIETDVYFYYAMWSYGGEIIEGGKSGLRSEAALKAASLYKGLIDQGLTEPGVTAYNREDVQNLFKKGRVGMMISAPFLASQIKIGGAEPEIRRRPGAEGHDLGLLRGDGFDRRLQELEGQARRPRNSSNSSSARNGARNSISTRASCR